MLLICSRTHIHQKNLQPLFDTSHMASKTTSKAPSRRPNEAHDALSEQYGGSRAPGWVELLPASWAPFIKLARLSPPAALFLIYFPHLFGLLHASRRLGQDVFSPETIRLSALLFGGSFFFSNAAHAWNDLIDAPIDRRVARTRNRPIANGSISRRAAFVFTVSQAAGAAVFLPFLKHDTAFQTIPTIIGTIYYPWAKLHTYFPQVILGFCLAWGIMVGSAAAGLERPWIDQGTICLVIVSVLWTVIYDTIYAHQDIKDDARVGVKSMALLLKTELQTKFLLWFLWLLMGSALIMYATLEGLGFQFYLIAVLGSLASQGAMIWKVELRKEESCWWWFAVGFWYVGLSIAGGLLSEHLVKLGGPVLFTGGLRYF